MASGTIAGRTSNQFISAKLSYSATANIAGNYSDVSVSLVYRRTNSGFTTQGTWRGSITINGTEHAGTPHSISITESGDTVAMTATERIYHDADGSKQMTLSVIGYISGTSLSSTDVSATVSLDTIPRATTPQMSAASVDFGAEITFTLSPAAGSFRHNLTYTFGAASGTIASNVSTSATWEIPESLATQIPNALSGVCTVECSTYNGGTLIGQKTVMLTLTVPQTVIPTISGFLVTGQDDYFERFIQRKSTVIVNFTANGTQGSTPTAAQVEIDGRIYRGTIASGGTVTVESSTLLNAGAIPITITVTDSRGRSAAYQTTINVIEYFAPEVSKIETYRINVDGDEDDDGEYIALRLTASISPVTINYIPRNSKYLTLAYREHGAAAWLTVGTLLLPAYDYDDTLKLPGTPMLDVNKSYDFKVTLTDHYGDVNFVAESAIPTSFSLVEFNFSGRGLAIGKASEETDKLEIALPIIFRGKAISHIEFGEDDMPFGTGGTTKYIAFSEAFSAPPVVITNQVFDSLNIVTKREDVTVAGFTARLPAAGASGSRPFCWMAIGD